MSLERGDSLRVGTLIAFAVAGLTGCIYSPTIQPVDKSRSEFDGAVYPGEVTIIGNGTPGNNQYRVFNESMTCWASVASVRAKAEKLARDWCHIEGEVMNPLREIAAEPPYQYPCDYPARVEIVFECLEKPNR
jgi:hypothetical protein